MHGPWPVGLSMESGIFLVLRGLHYRYSFFCLDLGSKYRVMQVSWTKMKQACNGCWGLCKAYDIFNRDPCFIWQPSSRIGRTACTLWGSTWPACTLALPVPDLIGADASCSTPLTLCVSQFITACSFVWQQLPVNLRIGSDNLFFNLKAMSQLPRWVWQFDISLHNQG